MPIVETGGIGEKDTVLVFIAAMLGNEQNSCAELCCAILDSVHFCSNFKNFKYI